jgi:AraC family transcriptional regulator
MDVTVKEMPEMRVGAVRHVGPYNQIHQAFGKVGKSADATGLLREPGTAMIAIYYDDPETTPPDQLRSDAGIVVSDDARLPDGLVEHRLPAGRYALAVHIGPYDQLGEAWARFFGEWLPKSRYRIRDGASYEIYRNDPTKVPKEELRTDMHVPIA